MDIGAAVRAAREDRRLTQSELAEAIGVTRQAIAALEANQGRVATLVGLEKLVRLRIAGIRRGLTIAEEISAKRARAGWSLRIAADRSGLAVNTIRALEKGRGSTRALSQLLTALAPGARLSTYTPKKPPRDLITVATKRDQQRAHRDHYTTPPALVRLLLDHEQFARDSPILEPAVGEHRVIDKVLQERGYTTICFDIEGKGRERRSFFDVSSRYHTLITNPPFALHKKFIEHAKRVITHKMALLMPLNYLTGANRYAAIWSDESFPVSRVHVLTRGVNFQGSDPESDYFNASQIYMAWYVFERGCLGPTRLNWIDSDPWVSRLKTRAR